MWNGKLSGEINPEWGGTAQEAGAQNEPKKRAGCDNAPLIPVVWEPEAKRL